MKAIGYTHTAARALIRHANKAKLIRAKIAQYAERPAAQARNVKALSGVDASRLRVQDFRVLFTETDDTITILDIGPARRDLRLRRYDMAVKTKTPKGDEIVILDRKEYDRLIAAAGEDAVDAATARRALARLKNGKEKTPTTAEVDELMASKTPLAFYRKKAGWTQAALSDRVGIAQGYLSEIESGLKAGDVQTLRKIADALKISLDDIIVSEVSIESLRPKRKAV